MAATFSHCMVTQYAYGPDLAESDIVDARDEPVDLCDNLRDIPERPPARLDFNGVEDDDYEPEEVLFLRQERAHAATLQWTRSLLERSNTTQDTDGMDADEDMDITGANPDDSYDSCPSLDSSSSSISVTSSMSSTSLSSTTFGMGDLDDDDDAPADVETSGSSTHSSMDIDADPFGSSYTDSIQAPSPLCPLIAAPHDTAEHEHTDELSLLRRHRYSLLPSPLSPNRKPATHSQSTTARHCYRHHGFSRQAFMHLKWFWAVRQEEWEEYTNNVRDAKAYGGVESESDDCIRAPWSRSPRPSIIEEPAAPPLTIHPRRGDLSALRDPYAAHIDRCFVSLPLWTMNKTLWMFDVHTAREYAAYKARATANLAGSSHDYADDSDDEPMLVSVPTTATSLSDDSDVTLVDSETGDSSDDSDCETHAGHWQRRGACIIGAATVASMNIKASAFKHSTDDDDDFMMLEDVNLNESGPASAGRCPSSVALADGRAGAYCPPWQTNWYRRWELLIELMRHDRERATVATPSPPSTPRPSGRKPHFYFAGDDESDGWSELV